MWTKGLTNDDNIYIMVTYKATTPQRKNEMETLIITIAMSLILVPIFGLGIQDARRHPWK